MKNSLVKIFTDKEKIADFLAGYLEEIINQKGADKNISLALSGGSTPKEIFKFLSKNYKDKIKWEKINIFFCDERCVPPIDKESNFKMINDVMLSKVPIPQNNIFRIKGENIPQKEAIRYSEILEKNMNKVNGVPQCDLVLLGVGEDGHTASIFSNQKSLYNSNNLCEVTIQPKTGQKRITITGKIINNSKAVIFIVTGKNKSKIISSLFNDSNLYNLFPVSLIIQNREQVIWLLDKEAANGIE